ncbi:hypothetical protein RJ641_033242 [Dillenia turbinata]|uniref:Uncharacterized protein n=1 Tax=Dillenia turbinata TaxID=194707 RepID=A0AAN8ZFW2_9MAGN
MDDVPYDGFHLSADRTSVNDINDELACDSGTSADWTNFDDVVDDWTSMMTRPVTQMTFPLTRKAAKDQEEGRRQNTSEDHTDVSQQWWPRLAHFQSTSPRSDSNSIGTLLLPSSSSITAFKVFSEIVRHRLSPAILCHLFYTPIRIVSYEPLRNNFSADSTQSVSLSSKAFLGGL